MSYKWVLDAVIEKQFLEDIPPFEPVTPLESAAISREFYTRYGVPLPVEYCNLIQQTDGILYEGLTVWPSRKNRDIDKGIIEANDGLRSSFDDTFLYYASLSDSYFVQDVMDSLYKMKTGDVIVKIFDDFDEMLEFALNQAVYS